jgi:hypothetical protein
MQLQTFIHPKKYKNINAVVYMHSNTDTHTNVSSMRACSHMREHMTPSRHAHTTRGAVEVVVLLLRCVCECVCECVLV